MKRAGTLTARSADCNEFSRYQVPEHISMRGFSRTSLQPSILYLSGVIHALRSVGPRWPKKGGRGGVEWSCVGWILPLKYGTECEKVPFHMYMEAWYVV